MIIGTHIVVDSRDADADGKFFSEILGLSSVDAGGGYIIFGLPKAEASVHQSASDVPHHELYFLCDDIDAFRSDMANRGIDCGPIGDQSWGRVMKLTLPSGAPLHFYQPRHARPK